jgi:hypothetical protein
MLFGKVIKQDSPFKFSEEDNEEVAPTLVIHNAALGPGSKGVTSLWVRKDGQEFLIATLNEQNSFASIQIYLFIEDESELFVKGNGSVHLVGSFENDEDIPREFGEDIEGESDEEDDEESDDEEEAAPVKPQQVLKGNQGNKPVQATKPQQGLVNKAAPAGAKSPSNKSPVTSPKLAAKAPVVQDE